MRAVCILLFGLGVTACTTTSFAPPDIPIRYQVTDTSVARDCAPALASPSVAITRTVEGAVALTDNFIIGYRCGMRAAADGRQPWELLAFLSLVGSTAATALGAGPDVAIVGGAANSVFTAGRAYYAPQQQAEILSDAVDALLCIQTESVGISAFTLQSAAQAEVTTLRTWRRSDVAVTVETQYFNMVAAALLSVERVAAERLRQRGSFDAAGVASQIEQLAEEVREAEAARDAGPDTAQGQGFLDSNARGALYFTQSVQLELNLLRPKLEQCVTRAKV